MAFLLLHNYTDFIKNFLNIANVKIKASNTDKAIFTAQCILAVTTIICLLIS
nr:hypothetical protein [Staphylococcus aureus]